MEKKDKFKFKNIIFDYVGDILYVYFLTDNNTYNKEIDLLVKDMGYIRDRLVKERPLLSLKIGTEYKRMGIYYPKEKRDLLDAEIQRYEYIRKAPILQFNK